MKVARSSSIAVKSAAGMVATSERAGTGSSVAASLALRASAMRSDRSRRALRSAALASSFGSAATVPPRLRVMIESIRRRPSKASRA